MLRAAVDFALNNRILIVAFAVLLFIWGGISFHQLPVEAYPDVANNYVEVITQWPGISAEQIEQQVTIPLEIVMNGIPHLTALRSFSLFGLSDLKMTFDDESENDWNREKVLERLAQVNLPPEVQPQMGTDWSPVGQIYFFTLQSTNPNIRRDGAEVDRGLGHRKAVQIGAECGRCGQFRRAHARISGARRSQQADLLRPQHRPGGAAAYQ